MLPHLRHPGVPSGCLQLAMHSGMWPKRLFGLSEGLPAVQHQAAMHKCVVRAGP